ncbi:MAG: M1 family metallopeptidase [Balneolales bacterium]
MNVIRLLIISFSLALITACGTTQTVKITETAPDIEEASQENGWTIPDNRQQFLRPRTWDLQHQKLWVRFDFKQEQVIGNTELFLTSLSNRNNELILDAKTMVFDSIYTVHSGEHLAFRQDSARVTIDLPEQYNREDSLFIGISYLASPPERGLYFADPQDLDPTKPTQVWTLGQPEDNSFWFPTIDSPMERSTHETWISVPEQYKTLSNGALIESRVQPGDSLRTDYWMMNKPHAPYLFALAVGEYDITKTWNHDVLFRYYTEPQYTQYVDLIYKDTEDMLEYIKSHTGIDYPWGFYAQVPVHDFIAAGMENTTASMYFDDIQVDERAHQDISHQGLLMHELIHQWFGNYVTSKNWANLPLNEGFANYFEILYAGYRQGDDEAIWESLVNRDQYFTEAQTIRRPIIFNRYNEPEDMYDRHTYAKTGQVLRMLHNYVGGKTWWSALNAYLTEYAFDQVDVSDLQKIFEQETGENLNWFFEQWFHQPGHPELEVSADTTGNELQVRIRQVHNTERQPVFTLHTELEISTTNSLTIEEITIDKPDSIYRFTLDGTLEDVILDPNSVQLAVVSQHGNHAADMDRLDHPSVALREYSIRQLSEAEWSSEIENAILHLAEHDPYKGIRSSAMELLAENSHDGLTDFALSRIYENEPEGPVRRYALQLLEDIDSPQVKNHIKSMTTDTSYYVAAEAIGLYGTKYPEDAHKALAKFSDEDSYDEVIRTALTEALINSPAIEAYQILYQLAEHQGDYDYIRMALAGLSAFVQEHDVEGEIKDLYNEKLNDPYEATRTTVESSLEYFDNDVDD